MLSRKTALQVTTMTLTPFKILHLEPTDSCQAACPQCARETDDTFDKQKLHHLTADYIYRRLGEDVIRGLDKMFMCGDYGDPAAGRHTLEIYRLFRQLNQDISLGMNSNGGLRNTKWWRELASILNRQQDYAIFSIDGLEDTNHVYRVNVIWQKVIENAEAFIQAGGNAHWDMLVFEHNEHQVDKCEQLAKDMGFKWFRAKVTRRHDVRPVEFLRPPKGWRDPKVTAGPILCQALEEDSRYMSATGLMYPCCHLGITDKSLDKFDDIKQSWATKPHTICKETCTESETQTSFTNQWQREVEF